MPDASPLFSYFNIVLLLQGAATTLLLTIIAGVAGFSVGLLLAIVRLTRSRSLAPLRAAAFSYCLLLRRVPFLVTLMLVFFASQWSGADLPILVVALLSATLIASAYLGEVVRAGLMAVPENQWNTASTLNFSYLQALRYIILPQAWRLMVPPGFAFLVSFLKDTALASQLGVMELTSAGKVLADKGYVPGVVYGVILMLYFAMSYPLARIGKHLENKLAADRVR